MASSEPVKHEWIVILPDHEGALQSRMKVRPYVSAPYPRLYEGLHLRD
jgi:hypothetical protein